MSLRIFVIGLILLILGACSVETQKGRESFSDGQLHPQIEKLANQKLELRPLKDQIIARTQQDTQLLTLPIAVIDNGVDIAHPDLVSKYIYDISNNEIMGVGKDFMGDDNYASSVLINPESLTFNAVEIKDGLIVSQNKNPFQQLIDLDKEFADFFMQQLKLNTDLQNSYFSKVTSESIDITAFGFYRFVLDQKENQYYFSQDAYEENKLAGKLLSLDFRTMAAQNPVLAKAWSLQLVYDLLDKKLVPLSALNNQLTRIEHGDKFASFIVDTFNKFPKKDELINGVEKLAQYKEQRNHNIVINHQSTLDDAAAQFDKIVNYFKWGSSSVDPLLGLFSLTESHLIGNLDLFRKPNDFPVLKLNDKSVEEALQHSFDKLDIYTDVLNKVKLSAQEKFNLRLFKSAAAINKEFVTEFKNDFGPEFNKILDDKFKSNFTSLFRKHYFRSKHPFISSFSQDESHGTHVSGIISVQNKDLRIYPIRITTRSAQITRSEYAKLLTQFKADFKNWLKETIVIKAIFKKLPTVVHEFSSEPTTEAEKEFFAQKMMSTFDESIEIVFEGEALNFIFFDELLNALKHVGEKKIKVANISLGAETQNEIPKFSEINTDTDLPKLFRFLHFEFVKFKAAEVLTTTAKDSLFVVAAGNSSTWIDGKSKSALPVDLSSRFLAEVETETLQAPNNHLTNILGVGSLNPDEDLSGFTNIILGIKTPMIFAIGEDILSPIKMTDLSPVGNYLAKKIPAFTNFAPLAFSDPRVMEYLKSRPEFFSIKENEEFESKVQNYFGYGLYNLEAMANVYKSHLSFKYSDHREHFSGTSMATPAVVGVIGDMILKQAQALNLNKNDIYDHPSFKPEIIIQEVFKLGKPVFADNPIFPFTKLNVAGKYTRGTQIQKLDQKIDSVLSRVKK